MPNRGFNKKVTGGKKKRVAGGGGEKTRGNRRESAVGLETGIIC